EVLYTANGYARYRIHAQVAGATPVPAPDRDFRADVDALLERVNARTRVVALANPDNPSGLYTPAAEVRRLHAGLPASCILLLDCAYAEYVERDDYELPVELVHESPNVVMTRTFSKVHGLAGLRLGWMYGPPALIDAVAKVGPSFPVSSPAIEIGIAALADEEHVRVSVEHNTRWRDWFTARMEALDLHVYPSQTNFLLMRFGDRGGCSAEAAFQHWLGRGIIARRIAAPAFADCVRISIGSEAAMRAAADSMTAFLHR
ncbi:MAG: aminotransferase class I/II-fold pyridoxal phosphate-dependent enzyme, partial [Planctomycetes bacterium]|nr:aminotransferase class I/II-fold pyridoxal phosphate-dependent enzyme [Planctomycetota bacterium]